MTVTTYERRPHPTADRLAFHLSSLGYRSTSPRVLEMIDAQTPDGGPEERRAVFAALVALDTETCPGCANRVSPQERMTGRCAKSGETL